MSDCFSSEGGTEPRPPSSWLSALTMKPI